MMLVRLTLNINNMKNYDSHGDKGNNNLSFAMKEAYDFFYKTY